MVLEKSLKLIALRILDDACVGKKRLYPQRIYYLQKGVDIEEPGKIVVSAKFANEMQYGTIFDEYFKGVPYEKTPSLSISTIVGKNGSGKSSIVEMIMRLINNFATSTFGENPPMNKSVERLRYIDGIKAELYYELDKEFFCLRVMNRNVRVDQYSIETTHQNGSISYCQMLTPYYDNQLSGTAGEEMGKMLPYPTRNTKEHRTKLGGFFYTLVQNYCIYAYNTNDYKKDCCSIGYERDVQDRKTGCESYDERCWLRGLFHKNDGYQRPIVISPYREEGSINIKSENELLRDRFLGLLLTKESFAEINGHLLIKAIEVSLSSKTYGRDYLRGKKKGQYTRFYPYLAKNGYDRFKELILQYWGDTIGHDLSSYRAHRKHYELAVDYLVCKTLKIAAQYAQYNAFYLKHQNVRSRIDKTMLERLVKNLNQDHSHITKKIRQTLAYIVFGTFEGEEWKDADIKMSRDLLRKTLVSNSVKSFIQEGDELVPPPFFNVKIMLYDTKTNANVEFETLSSGEKQQIFSISSVLYHLQNIASVFHDDNKQRIEYSHALVILEEIELYYHPELQQQFIKYLLDGIQQMHFDQLQALSFLIVTHSPFVLSDIPADKILAIDDGKPENADVMSFGANIHEMLRTGFFLPTGAVGMFARWMIQRLAVCLKLHRYVKEHGDENNNEAIYATKIYIDDLCEDKQVTAFLNDYLIPYCEEYRYDLLKITRTYNQNYIFEHILLLDEPIVREALLREYHSVFPHESREQELEELRKKITDLEAEK